MYYVVMRALYADRNIVITPISQLSSYAILLIISRNNPCGHNVNDSGNTQHGRTQLTRFKLKKRTKAECEQEFRFREIVRDRKSLLEGKQGREVGGRQGIDNLILLYFVSVCVYTCL